ncbi:RNA polymerase sigma factor [Actinoplanes sp. NPDC026619]|uniref:RNA polymerase sigma factor n=1 Tax=Actinoplanes sp. NPDC026619 TaxID=3155798 RepID=UPI0033F2709D
MERTRFEALYAETWRDILGYALRRTGNPEDAADVVAEVFTVAWRRRADVPAGPAARPWLYGVARLVLANQRRGDLRRGLLATALRDAVRSTPPDPAAVTLARHDARAVRAGLHALPEIDRELLMLTAWDGLSPAEAADPLRVDLAALPDEAAEALAQEILMQANTEENETATVRSRRRRRGYVVALVTAGAIAVPGIAVAGVVAYQGMHSGVYGDGGETVAGEELLYTDAPEITGVVRDLTAEFPLPAGATYDRLLARYPMTERVLVQRTALGQQVQITAACAWYQDWLTGDAQRRAADQHTIDAVPTWKYWVFADSGRALLERIAQETRSGTDTTVKEYLLANCI